MVPTSMARHTGARCSVKRMHALTTQARTTLLAEETQGLAVTRSRVGLDGSQATDQHVGTDRSDESQAQPMTEGLPPHGRVVRRLGRAPWQRWTREGAMLSVRCTTLGSCTRVVRWTSWSRTRTMTVRHVRSISPSICPLWPCQAAIIRIV